MHINEFKNLRYNKSRKEITIFFFKLRAIIASMKNLQNSNNILGLWEYLNSIYEEKKI